MNEQRLNEVLAGIRGAKVAVVGDFCVDRYFHIDPKIGDVSKETGLGIHQVTAVRPELGGGANVVHNLAALGAGSVIPVGIIGSDGEGFELACLLETIGVRRDFLRESTARHTPVYLKPLVIREGGPPEELNRFDIFPRQPPSPEEEERLLADLKAAFAEADALIVADYTEAGKCGVVTPRVREAAAELARTNPDKPVVADSRLFVDRFRHAIIKPNAAEAMAFLAGRPDAAPLLSFLMELGQSIAERNRRPVIITLGADGALLCTASRALKVPCYPSERHGPIDPVGAGDTVVATVAAALAGNAALDEAVIIAMIAASITIQEIGRCGTASPDQIRARFRQYAAAFPEVVAA